MSQRLRPKLSYSNVVATIALFLALGGAAVAAGLPKNSVGANQLKRGAVTEAKLRKKAVTKNKIAPKAVTIGKLGPQAVAPWNIGNGAVNANKIGANAVIASKIRNKAVTTNKLNSNAVTQAKLAPEAVGSGNLQPGSVTLGKLADDVTPLVGTLKSGQTLRGVFSVGSTAQAEGQRTRAATSYQFPLLAAPTQTTILAKGSTTTECGGLSGGNEQTPLADPGNLCIYIDEKENLNELENPLEVDYSIRLGFGLAAESAGIGQYFAQGQWAVTAP